MNTDKNCCDKKGMLRFVFAAAMGICQGVLALGTSLLIVKAVNYAQGDRKTTFTVFCAFAFSYFAVYILFFALAQWTNANAVSKYRLLRKDKFFYSFLWQKYEDYNKKQKGDTLALFKRIIDSLENDWYTPLLGIVRNIAVLLVSMAAMLIYQWYLGILCGLILGLYIFLTKGISRKLETTQNELVEASISESNEMSTMLKSFQVSMDYGVSDYFFRRYSEAAGRNDTVFAKLNSKYNILNVVNTMIDPVITFMIIAVLGVMLNRVPGLTVAGILGMTQLASAMLQPVGSLGSGIAQIKSTRSIRKNIKENEERAEEGFIEWNRSERILPAFEGINISNVSFDYDDKAVLSHVNLKLTANGKYAIVGESGGGKTTLINLLVKLLYPVSGSVFWNDIDYQNITCGDIIDKVGYVGQNPMMLPADVRTNIVAGESYDIQKLQAVLDLSQLSDGKSTAEVEDFLNSSAMNLSGGERKRVAFARALYKNKPILILDEVTSSVKKDMAEELEKAALTLDDTMVLHITHGLSDELRKDYDGIISVENGTVIV